MSQDTTSLYHRQLSAGAHCVTTLPAAHPHPRAATRIPARCRMTVGQPGERDSVLPEGRARLIFRQETQRQRSANAAPTDRSSRVPLLVEAGSHVTRWIASFVRRTTA